MYIQLTITATQWQFQKKDEAGNNIGSVEAFAFTAYELVRDEGNSYFIYPATQKDRSFPPKAGYPKDRVLIIST